MPEDKLKQFYEFIPTTKRVDDSFLGDYNTFSDLVADSNNRVKLFKNLAKAGFTENEIGTEQQFHDYFNTIFPSNGKAAGPVTKQDFTGSTIQVTDKLKAILKPNENGKAKLSDEIQKATAYDGQVRKAKDFLDNDYIIKDGQFDADGKPLSTTVLVEDKDGRRRVLSTNELKDFEHAPPELVEQTTQEIARLEQEDLKAPKFIQDVPLALGNDTIKLPLIETHEGEKYFAAEFPTQKEAEQVLTALKEQVKDEFEIFETEGQKLFEDELTQRVFRIRQIDEIEPKQKRRNPRTDLRGIISNKPFWDTYVGDMIQKVGAGGAEAIANLESVKTIPFKMAINSATKDFSPEIRKAVTDIYLSSMPSTITSHASHEYFKSKAEELRSKSDRYENKDFTELWSEDKGAAIGQIFLTASESIPISIAAMFGGAPGLIGIGVSTAAGKYDSLNEPDKNAINYVRQANMGEVAKLTNAVLTGASEAGSEYLGSVPFGKYIMNSIGAIGGKATKEVLEKGLAGWMQKMFKKFGLAFGPVIEGVEEFANAIAENTIDYFTGARPDYKPFDEAGKAFVYGFAGGSQFAMAASLPMAYGELKTLQERNEVKKSLKSSIQDYVNARRHEDGNIHEVLDVDGNWYFVLEGDVKTGEGQFVLVNKKGEIKKTNSIRPDFVQTRENIDKYIDHLYDRSVKELKKEQIPIEVGEQFTEENKQITVNKLLGAFAEVEILYIHTGRKQTDLFSLDDLRAIKDKNRTDLNEKIKDVELKPENQSSPSAQSQPTNNTVPLPENFTGIEIIKEVNDGKQDLVLAIISDNNGNSETITMPKEQAALAQVMINLPEGYRIKQKDGIIYLTDAEGISYTFRNAEAVQSYLNETPVVNKPKSENNVPNNTIKPHATEETLNPKQENIPGKPEPIQSNFEQDNRSISELEEQKADIERRRQKELKQNNDIELARSGDEKIIESYNEYGLDYEKTTLRRFVSGGEVESVLRGEKQTGRFKDGKVDVTSQEEVTTAATNEYRITFNDSFDFNNGGKATFKNKDLGDGNLKEGYTIDDVLKIEKINDDGSYSVVYEGKNKTIKDEINAKYDAQLAALENQSDKNQQTSSPEQIKEQEAATNPNPSDAQKEAGNFKKGHIAIQGLDITIENPKGSERSGIDKKGKAWSQTMNNTYGYFKRSKGKDGDQIDVFIGDNLESDKVFVVDQVNNKGKFDEHKVMMGFNSIQEAKEAYLSNYEEGWQGLGEITEVNISDFKKWLDNGTRKQKAFMDYKRIKKKRIGLLGTRLEASKLEVYTPYELAQMYFILGGQVNHIALFKLFGTKGKENEPIVKARVTSEKRARFPYYSNKKGLSIDEIAHKLWEENEHLHFEDSDYRDAIGEVILSYNSPITMAKDLLKAHGERGMNQVQNEPIPETIEPTIETEEDIKNNERIDNYNERFADVINEEFYYDNTIFWSNLVALTENDPEYFTIFPHDLTKGEFEEFKKIIKDDTRRRIYEKALGKSGTDEIEQAEGFARGEEDFKEESDESYDADDGRREGYKPDRIPTTSGTEDGAAETAKQQGESSKEQLKPFTPEQQYVSDEYNRRISELKDLLKTQRHERTNKLNAIDKRNGLFGDTQKEEGNLFDSEFNTSIDNIDAILQPFDAKISHTVNQIEILLKQKQQAIDALLEQTTIDFEQEHNPQFAGELINEKPKEWWTEYPLLTNPKDFSGSEREGQFIKIANVLIPIEKAKQFNSKDELLASMADENNLNIITEPDNNQTEKAKLDELEKEYQGKTVEELVELKKNLYPNPDIESEMSTEEKLLNKVIANKFSEINQQIKDKRQAEKPSNPQFAGELLDNELKQQSKNPNFVHGEEAKKGFYESVKKNLSDKDASRLDELRAKLKGKRGNFNTGIDPETFAMATEASYLVLKSGAKKFVEFAKAMIDMLGEGVKPYLKSFYEYNRYSPEGQEFAKEMTASADVEKINLQSPEYFSNFTVENTNTQKDVHDIPRHSERPSQDSSDEISSNEKPVSNDGRGSRPVRNKPLESDGEGLQPQRGEGGSGIFSSLSGKPSDNEVHKQDKELLPTQPDAGNFDGRGNDLFSSQGYFDDRTGGRTNNSETIEGDGDSFKERTRKRRIAQHNAETIPVQLMNKGNITETLPYLLPEQQDDVLKTETRFFSPNHKTPELAHGKGMLITNGTGTGKTLSALGVIKRFIKQGKKEILIVVPAEAKIKDWIKEANNLNLAITGLDNTKDGGRGINVTTYANFRSNPELLKRDFDLVVYDESHRLMEDKNGTASATTFTHYAMGNISVQNAFERIAGANQVWIEHSELLDKLRNLPKDASREIKDNINKRLKQLEEKKKEITPSIQERAQAAYENTKVMLLSATPFKTHFNLRYVNGVLFDWGNETITNARGSRVNPEARFFLEKFGAAYEWKYHQLQSKANANADAIAMQEVQFADDLMAKGVMTGRIIESDKDYSREFPLVALDNAEGFNKAFNAIFDYSDNKKFEELRSSARDVFYNYNYTTQLFESLKASMVLPRMQKHLDLGRKIVVFHRRKQANVQPPFEMILKASIANAALSLEEAKKKPDDQLKLQEAQQLYNKTLDEVSAFRKEYADLLEYEQGLSYNSAIDQIVNRFGGHRVALINGDVSKKDKPDNIKKFNDDDSGVDIIVIQEEAGKEGISLHDTSGKHQRVLINLSIPISSTTALQIEGRIFRIGQESNAIFENPLLGLDMEIEAFGRNVNRKLSTTENLAVGSKARDLIRSIAEGVLFNSSANDPKDDQGVGGKEYDQRVQELLTQFRKAVLTYHTNQKTTGRRDQREGIDYYATPEPLGQKMVEWLGLKLDGTDTLLEPSAGHGAIAMWFPDAASITAVEPSFSLYSKLSARSGGGNRKILNQTFEDLNIINKFTGIAMNPPFGQGGSLAMKHLEKAFGHLKEGGRVVALIPTGQMDNRLDKFLYGEDEKGKALNPNAHLIASIKLPNITFEQAGTKVGAQIVVIDKITQRNIESFKSVINAEQIKKLTNERGYKMLTQSEIATEAEKRFNEQTIPQQQSFDLSHVTKIENLFDEIEHLNITGRMNTETTEPTENTIKEADKAPENVFKLFEQEHSKTGETLYMAKPNFHLGDNYKKITEIAGTHNGFYSSYKNKASNIQSGFVFKTESDRKNFDAEVLEKIYPEENLAMEPKNSYLAEYLQSDEAQEQENSYKTRKGENIPYRSLLDSDSETRPNQVRENRNRSGNSPHLRKLKKGEFSTIERKYTADKNFSFTGNNTIESHGDIAFLFRQLETASVENAFAVYIDKNGKAVIQHLSMGTFAGTIIDQKLIIDGVKRFNAEKVYFVHNHPSGNLQPSNEDVSILNKLKSALPSVDVLAVIININSGEYSIFHDSNHSVYERYIDRFNESDKKKYPVLKFDRQVFKDDVKLFSRIKSSQDIAAFISAQRLSAGKKGSLIVLNRTNNIKAKLELGAVAFSSEQADEVASYVIRFGGESAILFGRYGKETIKNRKSDVNTFNNILKAKGITLLDVIDIGSKPFIDVKGYDGFSSMADLGLISEPSTNNNLLFDIADIKPSFKEQLQDYIDGNFPSHKALDINVSKDGVLEKFIAPLPLKMRQRVLKKHQEEYEAEQLFDLEHEINNPVFILQGEHQGSVTVLTKIKDKKGNNILGAIELNVKMQEGIKFYEVNNITSLYGKTSENLLKWIENGKLLYAEKEKGLDWLVSQTGSDSPRVLTIQNLIVQKYEEYQRKSSNDLKFLIRPETPQFASEILTDAYYQKYLAWEKAMKDEISRVANELGLKVISVPSEESLPRIYRRAIKSRGMEGKATGFFDTESGAIYVIIANNKSTKSVYELLLHEGVAHKGLRLLFGDKYNAFLESIYNQMTAKDIDTIIKRGYNPDDKHEIADEFLAKMAEPGKRPTWFDKIIAQIRELIRKIFGLNYSNKDIINLLELSRRALRKQQANNKPKTGHNPQFAAELLDPRFMTNLWHGSPHLFDKFSIKHIGTGEGAQAYGWGLYFTDREGIARSYAKNDATFKYNGNENSFISLSFLSKHPELEDVIDRVIEKYPKTTLDKTDMISSKTILASDIAYLLKTYPKNELVDLLNKEKDIYKNLNNEIATGILMGSEIALEYLDMGLTVESKRNLYKVKIHGDKTIEELNFLRWDKLVGKEVYGKILDALDDKNNRQFARTESNDSIGSDVYKSLSRLLGSDKEASLFLLRAGIDGIQYPAEYTSKGSHENSFNYVVFDENAIEVDDHIRFSLNNQTSTPEFKQWFGDWEKPARIEKLKQSKPLIMSGNEYKGKYELNRASAQRYILDNLRARYINKDTGDEITLTRRGTNKVTSHDSENTVHLKSIAAIPEMIENAIFITEEKNTKENAPFDAFRYYVVGLKIDNEDYTARITIGKEGKNYYYDHGLTQIEKGELITNIGLLERRLNSDQLTLSDYKDTRLISLLQDNSSKVVDVNGKPLVVYHGTRSEVDFESFLPNEGLDAFGSFFAGNPETASVYSTRGGDINSRVIPVYLSIINPIDYNSYMKLGEYPEERSDNAMNKGYDGIIYEGIDGNNYVVFSPNQIKSATGNNGDFNTKNTDIRFSLSPGEYLKRLDDYKNAEPEYQKIVDKFKDALKNAGLADSIMGVSKSQTDYGMSWYIKLKDIKGNETYEPFTIRISDHAVNSMNRLFDQNNLAFIDYRYVNESDYDNIVNKYIQALDYQKQAAEKREKHSKAAEHKKEKIKAESQGFLDDILQQGKAVFNSNQRFNSLKEIKEKHPDWEHILWNGNEIKDHNDRLWYVAPDNNYGKKYIPEIYYNYLKKEGLLDSPGLSFKFDEEGEWIEESDNKHTPNQPESTEFAGELLEGISKHMNRRRKLKQTLESLYTASREVLQDRDLLLRHMLEDAWKNGGKKTEGGNPYRDKNLGYGRMENLYTEFKDKLMMPLVKAINKLEKVKGVDLNQIMAYMIAKHAPERNAYIRKQKLEEWLTFHENASEDEVNEMIFELSLKDFSGIGALDLTNEHDKRPDELANRLAAEFEAKVPKELIDEFWQKIKPTTDFAIEQWLASEAISDKQYQEIKKMYKHFVPLRGWHEAAEKYLSYHHRTGGEPSIQKTLGRVSLPDNPIAYIEQVAFKSITERVNNEVNQALLEFVMVNPNKDLYELKEVYYVKVEDGKGENDWVMTTTRPDQAMFKAGKAKKTMYNGHERFRKPSQAKEHEVIVHLKGRDIAIVMKGEMLPIAQIMNHHNNLIRIKGQDVNLDAMNNFLGNTIGVGVNMLKQLYTSLNIVFPYTNYSRDLGEAFSTTVIMADGKQAFDYLSYNPTAFNTIRSYLWGSNFNPEKNANHKLYHEFLMDGGTTGYSHNQTIEERSRELKKQIENSFKGVHFSLTAVKEQIENISRLFEDATRFSIYVSARKNGKSRKDAAAEAKEASVNFNRKGKATKTFDSLFAFFNPAIQSLQKNTHLAKKYPKRFGTVSVAWMMFGFIIAELNRLFDDDEDDDKGYYNINTYVRENYLVLPVFGKESYLRIPLPQFWRGFYSWGVLASDVIHSKKTVAKAVSNGGINFASGLTPVDVGGFVVDGKFSIGPLIPTIYKPVYEIGVNRNFLDQPIYRAIFDETQLQSKLHLNYVNPALKVITDGLLAIAHPKPDSKYMYYKKEDGSIEQVPSMFDINPSKVEHLIRSYGGGTIKAAGDLFGMLYSAVMPTENVVIDNVPIINAFIRKYPEKNYEVDETYYKLKEAAEINKKLYNEAVNPKNMKKDLSDPKNFINQDDLKREFIIKEAERKIKQLKEKLADENIDLDTYYTKAAEIRHKAVSDIKQPKNK